MAKRLSKTAATKAVKEHFNCSASSGSLYFTRCHDFEGLCETVADARLSADEWANTVFINWVEREFGIDNFPAFTIRIGAIDRRGSEWCFTVNVKI